MSMDINQHRGNFPQQLHRRRPTIDLAEIAAAHLPRDEQGIILHLKAHLLNFGADILWQLRKQCRNIGAVLPTADNIPAHPCAQHSVDGRNQNRFTGTGLTGKDIEARAKIDGSLRDDSDIFDVQL